MNNKQSVALSSVFASLFLTLLKLIVGILTGSIGIISEAAHSFLDFGAALITLLAVNIGDKPADTSHPYGHEKIESISALAETVLLFLTSILIIYEAVKRLTQGKTEIEVTWYAFAVIAISIIVDISRSRALNKVAKLTNSQALEADALHFSSDILSSIVVLVGLFFVSMGITKADAIAAIGVSLFILRAGFMLGKRTIDVLVDTAPQGLTEEIIEQTKKVKGVIDVERIRVRPTGTTIFVDIAFTVDRKLPLDKLKEIYKRIEENIRLVKKETDITLHAKPLSLNNETIIERVQIIAANHNLSVHDIVIHTQKDQKYLSFDLEVNANLDIKKAHKIASHLEDSIKKDLGENLEINTHIEPLSQETITGKIISKKEEEKIKKIIEETAFFFKQIKGVHKITVRKVKKNYFITFHCNISSRLSLEEAHNLTARFEGFLREKLPKIKKVVIHIEPF